MRTAIWLLGALAIVAAAAAGAAPPQASLSQIIDYPFVGELVAARGADRIAWIENVRGARNVWVAEGPGFVPRQLTRFTADDGQELTQLGFDPTARHLVWVRGGDHDANWPAEGGLQPDPASSPAQPKVEIWTVPVAGGTPRMVAEGDAPSVSPGGLVAYVKDGQVWSAPLDGTGKAQRLFFDRGKDSKLAWSPDGSRLSFVSNRGDHSFVGIFTNGASPLSWLAPSSGRDDDPDWSPDGRSIVFTRRPGTGGAPQPMLARNPVPWSIWRADVATGQGQKLWQSPATLDGSYPRTADGVDLKWMAGDRIAFVGTLDGWQHLYVLPASGGTPRLLTPGRFMVEHVTSDRNEGALLYAANTGTTPGDDDRRHVYRVALDGSAPVALTRGSGNEWFPVPAGRGAAIVSADAQRPAAVAWSDGGAIRPIEARAPYPSAALVAPRPVTFRTGDGFTIHGQLFEPAGGGRHAAVVFVHGGPPRQMLLGWHYMDYYSNAYAVNQYLASRGFVVLSVNYRLGIGYGRAFEQPEHAGAQGGSEYRDVVAAGHFLEALPNVDPQHLGIWGGSYGGYLTAMALARNSDMFKAGVDFHGVHDWSQQIGPNLPQPQRRYEQGDLAEAMKVAFQSSPVADVSRWRSPVLFIHGDDDRNVRFNQTVDLIDRLSRIGAPYEEFVLPDEIHDFLRHDSWRKADRATICFLEAKLQSRACDAD
jgi:dipeptidyl aminopeptidase/acylaminoacyl peptidase